MENLTYNKPGIVLVTASKKVPYMTAMKGISTTLDDKVVKVDENGQKTVLRFLDERGNASRLHIPKAIRLNMSNPIDSHNLAVLKVRLSQDAALAEVVRIIDEEADAAIQNEKDLNIARAMSIVESLNNESGQSTLRAMYRRHYGSSEGVTDTLVQRSLIALAKGEPSTFKSLYESVNNEDSVFFDLLIENGIISKDGLGIIKQASDGVLLARSVDEYILKLSQDSEYKEYMKAILSKVISSKSNAAKQNLIPRLMKVAEEKEASLSSDTSDYEEPSILTEDEILHVVKLAVKSQLIQSKGSRFITDGSDFDRKGLDGYFKKNPGRALELKNELIGLGLYIELNG